MKIQHSYNDDGILAIEIDDNNLHYKYTCSQIERQTMLDCIGAKAFAAYILSKYIGELYKLDNGNYPDGTDYVINELQDEKYREVLHKIENIIITQDE